MSWRIDGFDVSHWNTENGASIDWDAAKASGMNWCATKTTQRNNYVDPTADRHRSEMKRVNFRHRLLYHWQSPTSECSIAAQVALWERTVGRLEVGEAFFADSEQAGITEPETFELVSLIEEYTKRPSCLYFGVYTAGGTLVRSERLRTSAYGPRPIILAAYMTQQGLAVRLQSLGLQNLVFHANQFSSNGVPGYGIVGRWDEDQINDVAAFDLACGITSQGEDMSEVYYNVTGANAKFIGCPTRVRWSGGGAKIEQAIAWQLALGNLVPFDLTGGPGAFAATTLEGPLPVGDTLYTWTGDEFANADEIHARQTTQGPPGPQGIQGPPGLQGAAASGEVTGTFQGQVKTG